MLVELKLAVGLGRQAAKTMKRSEAAKTQSVQACGGLRVLD